ncbi:MAG: TrkH family potassium uptake protein [Candidatus Fermentibacter sp.]|nr:TrkH family potassium uptake protein [Candidatus Fermentibacter sp.]
MIDRSHLLRRYGAMLASAGFVCYVAGLLMTTPLAALLFWPGESWTAGAFLVPGLSLAVAGFTCWRLLRSREMMTLTVSEGSVVVVTSWAAVCTVSALPLMSAAGLDFTQAVFESVSGWTTTGLTVVDLPAATHTVHLWRGIMQFAGGAGLAVILLSAMSGPMGASVTAAEGRDLLVPHVKRSARLVMTLYSGYAVAGIAAFRLAGMDPFDSVIHTFAAISTGGFSTHVENIGYFDSPAVEAVAIALMILGNLNFVTAWALARADARSFWRSGEIRLSALLIPLCAVLLFVFTCAGVYPSLGKSLRVAVFETVTALTTTGFSTVSYADWNGFGVLVLIVLMLVGGGTCSTAGGIKQFRIYALWRSVLWDLRRALMPSRAVQKRALLETGAEVHISDERLRQIGTFVFLYLVLFFTGSAVIMAQGFGFRESLFEFASSLGTVGASIGLTSPGLPEGVLWTMTAGMFLGRLEIFIVLAGFSKMIRDAAGLASGGRGRPHRG